ncbi:PH domain-containing protein [Paraflavitalea speifideaquila]|uniref:PH domain-containing protein n=1 Tax=Paraflavitalea speifideaquila TaxID=3076558 RepID=UPI0033130185
MIGAWVLITAAWYWLQEKAFSNKAYAIREKDVIYRSGWIIQSTHTCPFNRIQHSAVTIGPFEKDLDWLASCCIPPALTKPTYVYEDCRKQLPGP